MKIVNDDIVKPIDEQASFMYQYAYAIIPIIWW